MHCFFALLALLLANICERCHSTRIIELRPAEGVEEFHRSIRVGKNLKQFLKILIYHKILLPYFLLDLASRFIFAELSLLHNTFIGQWGQWHLPAFIVQARVFGWRNEQFARFHGFRVFTQSTITQRLTIETWVAFAFLLKSNFCTF